MSDHKIKKYFDTYTQRIFNLEPQFKSLLNACQQSNYNQTNKLS